MPDEKIVQIQGLDFSRGLVTTIPKHLIPLGAASFVQNVDFARSTGRIPKRQGIQTDQAELVGGNQVSGLFQYVLSTGSTFTMASKNNNLYSVAAGVWTSIYAGAMAGAQTNMATFKDLLIFVAETETTQKWDGVAGATSALLGTPPANARYITVWQNRVWIAYSSAGKSRLHWSASGQAEDWTTPGDAGYIDINVDDGDVITGIMPCGSAMFVFKKNTVHVVTGISPTTYSSRPIILNRGCVAPRSIISMGPFVVYLSQYGIHSVSQTVDGFLSKNIKEDIESISKTGAAAGKFRDLYLLAYDSDADSKNDSCYVLDVREGSWSFWTGTNASVFASKNDGTLLAGGSDKTIIRSYFNGEDDNGVAITMKWRSGQISPSGDFTALNTFLDTWFSAKPISGKTLTVNLRVDGVQVDSVSNSLTAHQISATDENIKVIGLDGVAAGQGRFLEVEFTNAETAAAIEIDALSIKSTVMPRQQTST